MRGGAAIEAATVARHLSPSPTFAPSADRRLITRRRLMQGGGALALGVAGLGSYAFAIEPGLMLDVAPYRLTPPGWPIDLPLRIAVIADIHACEPWMPAARIRAICELANRMEPDLTVILGDFNAGHNYVTAAVTPEQWAEAISVLSAPLGVYAILGNHDWWHGALPKWRGDDAESVRSGLRQAGVALLENDAKRLVSKGRPFWLAGLGDQLAYRMGHGHYRGIDDLDGTLAQVRDDAPVLLLAHEPFVFSNVPARVALTLCGHTHGGQVNLPFITDRLLERRFGIDRVYGHVVEDDRHMIISAGLGTSWMPVRFGRPPELVVVTLGQELVA